MTRQPRHLWLLVAILLGAATLRLTDLTDAPPGLQHDEVFHAHDAFTVRQGHLRLWFTSNAGNEPLFIYLMAASTALFGDHALGIRLPAVLAGLLTVAFSYRWARIAFGERAALMAGGLVGMSFWPAWMSRVGLRAVTLPPLVALSGWLYMRAITYRQSQVGAGDDASHRLRPAPITYRLIGRFVLAGVALGLTLYTYPAAFAAPLVFAALYVYMGIAALIRHRRQRAVSEWEGVRPHLAFWLACALTALPLALTLSGVEGGYLRVQQTALPLRALQSGDPLPLIRAARDTLLMWTTHGDPLWRYNIAGKPVFPPVLAGLFILGLAINLRLVFGRPLDRLPAPREGATRAGWMLVLLWLLIGVLPSAVTDSPPAFLRASAALPATYLTLALGIETVVVFILVTARNPWLRALIQPALIGLVIGVGLVTWRDYFAVWAVRPEVQTIYRTDLKVIAGRLAQGDSPSNVALSTSEPHHLDRFIFDYTPHGDADVRWFDGLYGLAIPGSGPSWLFITREPTPDPRLQHTILDHLPVAEERFFGNGSLAYRRYALPSADEFLRQFPPPQAQGVWAADPLAFPPDDPDGIRQPLAYPVQIGETLQLLGYEAMRAARPGEWLEVTLYFRVTADVTAPEPWALFLHLLRPDGTLAAGRDFLAVPASVWRAGDAFIQLHDLPLPDDLAAGLYHLEIGLYTQAGGDRFPVLVGGAPIGDRVLLEPVEISR